MTWPSLMSVRERLLANFLRAEPPKNPNGNVLQCASGLVVKAEAYRPGQSVGPVVLRDVLVDLATAHGARLEFVHGEAESRLLSEFGGLAALSRC